MKAILEVCCGDPASVRAAEEGGAARVELCSALEVGGVTPSAGFIAQAVKMAHGVKKHVLIRPREGDFVYTPDEVDIMVNDIEMCRSLGADGVVIGALLPDGSIDMSTCRRLVDAASGMSVTFHRAFDMVNDPMAALEAIIALGCDRILTSGLQPDALTGAHTLAALNKTAAGRITILAGCGVSASNAAEILRQSGCTEIHASARRPVASTMQYRRTDLAMGTPGADEFSRKTTHPDEVRAIVEAINNNTPEQ